MTISYDVRFWKTEVYKGKRTNSYYVRWTVAGVPFREPFKKSALAGSFKSQLVSAASRGEAFDVDTGLPVSMQRKDLDMPWYGFACSYVDLKWPTAAATTRRTNAEAMAKVTIAMISGTKGRPDDKLLRHALNRWAFNTKRRNDSGCPAEVRRVLQWVEKNTHNVSSLAKPEILRLVLNGIALRLDGKPGAPSVVNRQRKVFSASLYYAVERKLLADNPIPALKRTPVRTNQAIDKRCVANPVQVRMPPPQVHSSRGLEPLCCSSGSSWSYRGVTVSGWSIRP